ncbi:hypothetical protein [Vibrio owensii]|uniref:hypothetical protein n=1 Tax=Vibrio owensii TaxID=696485 RepID=UPI0018F21F8E|nr:hypothetical protein [Vibrio owensii]
MTIGSPKSKPIKFLLHSGLTYTVIVFVMILTAQLTNYALAKSHQNYIAAIAPQHAEHELMTTHPLFMNHEDVNRLIDLQHEVVTSFIQEQIIDQAIIERYQQDAASIIHPTKQMLTSISSPKNLLLASSMWFCVALAVSLTLRAIASLGLRALPQHERFVTAFHGLFKISQMRTTLFFLLFTLNLYTIFNY